ncbi:MAG: hypothetical protein V7L29_29780 [Nostoc sp.]|uniref:hypothetical protein n=1 Tax=Nostoc sp. TaxID=1180 RepID=UPI002FF8E940
MSVLLAALIERSLFYFQTESLHLGVTSLLLFVLGELNDSDIDWMIAIGTRQKIAAHSGFENLGVYKWAILDLNQ